MKLKSDTDVMQLISRISKISPHTDYRIVLSLKQEVEAAIPKVNSYGQVLLSNAIRIFYRV